MKIFAIVFFASLIMLSSIPAKAHDWYPSECCNEQDCTPAKITKRGKRFMQIESKFGRHFIPYGDKIIRPSQDTKVHICIAHEPGSEMDGHVLCVFIPAEV